jgi:hypothetical protein
VKTTPGMTRREGTVASIATSVTFAE